MLGRARPSNADALLRDLSSPDPRARITAAECAATVAEGDPELRARVVAALAHALEDDEPRVRAAVVLALADLGAAEALPALLVAADDDAGLVRELAITALGEIGDPRAQPRIRRALRDPRPEVRFQAIVAWPRIARGSTHEGEADALDHEIWEVLASGLDDDDAQVRGRAAEACAELADGATLPAAVADRLAEIASRETEPVDARVAAAIALGESRDLRAAPVLLGVIRGEIEEQDPRRIAAVYELVGELGLEEARSFATAAAFGLRARLGDPARRAAALVALIRLGDRRAIDHVLAELDARNEDRRTVAIGIVSRAELAEARPRLVAMQAREGADREGLDEVIAQLDRSTRSSA
jgi:HEAT repeat protein